MPTLTHIVTNTFTAGTWAPYIRTAIFARGGLQSLSQPDYGCVSTDTHTHIYIYIIWVHIYTCLCGAARFWLYQHIGKLRVLKSSPVEYTNISPIVVASLHETLWLSQSVKSYTQPSTARCQVIFCSLNDHRAIVDFFICQSCHPTCAARPPHGPYQPPLRLN